MLPCNRLPHYQYYQQVDHNLNVRATSAVHPCTCSPHPLHLCFFLPHYLDLVASCLLKSHCIPHFVLAEVTLQQTLAAPRYRCIAKQVDRKSNVCATPSPAIRTHALALTAYHLVFIYAFSSSTTSDLYFHAAGLVAGRSAPCYTFLSRITHRFWTLEILTCALHKYPPQPSQMPVNETFLSFFPFVCSPHLLTNLKYSHW